LAKFQPDYINFPPVCNGNFGGKEKKRLDMRYIINYKKELPPPKM